MADGILEILQEARKGAISGAVWNSLTEGEVVHVWETMAALIERSLVALHRGIIIPGFATINLSTISLDIGNNKHLLLQRPVFVLLEKFARVHLLLGGATATPKGDCAPVVPLNLTQLAIDTRLTRDQVESCVKEVVGAMSRLIAAKRSIELIFNGIGKLRMDDKRVKMSFFKAFIESVDGSGRARQTKIRPATADSASFEHWPLTQATTGPPRSYTSMALRRPQLNGTIQDHFALDDPALAVVAELRAGLDDDDYRCGNIGSNEKVEKHNEDVSGDAEDITSSDTVFGANLPSCESKVSQKSDVDFMWSPISELNQRENDNKLPVRADSDRMILNDTKPHGDVQNYDRVVTANNRRTPMSIPCATAVAFTDQQEIQRPYTAVSGISQSREIRSWNPVWRNQSSRQTSVSDSFSSLRRFSRTASSLSAVRVNSPSLSICSSVNTDVDRPVSPQSLAGSDRPLIPHPPGTTRPVSASCGHSVSAGQELCYVCYQRAQNNVAVDLSKERQRQEEENNRRLEDFQREKNRAETEAEEQKMRYKRDESQRLAESNVAAAEAKVASEDRSRVQEFQPSFVLRRRLATPPKFIAQENYKKDLETQVLERMEAEKKRKEDEDLQGRLEQANLLKDLTKRNEENRRLKLERIENYRRALSAQLQTKTDPPHPSPSSASSASAEPYFGRNEKDSAALAQDRRRTQQLYHEQLETVKQTKRDAILKRIDEQRREETMLQRTQSDLDIDRAQRYELMLERRKSLENNWIRAAQEKKMRDAEEKEIRRGGRGVCAVLVQEQCNRYRRCWQCKRRLENLGASNVLPATLMMT